MKGYLDEVLLDTTYLLPIFGVGIDLRKFDTLFEKLLAEYTVMYNPISLIEGKWIVIRLAKANPSKRDLLFKAYRRGLEVLLRDEKLRQTILTNHEIEKVADELLFSYDLRDYFDRTIYATALYQNIRLLTEDDEMVKLAKANHAPRPKEVLTWGDISHKIHR